MPTNRSIDVLRTAALTANVLNIEEPPGLFKGLLADPVTPEFPRTDNIEFGRERRNREGAPFIPDEAEAIYVGDRSRTLTSMAIPNIAMRKSIRSGDIAHDRSMGDAIILTGTQAATQSNGLEARRDRYQRDMVARIENTLEWWMSRILDSGQVSYSNSAYDAFVFDFGRNPAHTFTVGTLWSVDDSNAPNDIQTVKSLVGNAEYVNVTVGICGQNVAAQIRTSATFAARLDNRNLDEFRQVSYIDLSAPYSMQGALTPLGRLNGIDFWEYNRQVTLIGESPVNLVDPNAIYFFATENADIRVFYGPCYDMEEAPGTPIITERFSKSWTVPYPSELQMLVQSKPMIAPFRPDFCAKMTVTS